MGNAFSEERDWLTPSSEDFFAESLDILEFCDTIRIESPLSVSVANVSPYADSVLGLSLIMSNESIIVIEHCVSATAPRCLETYEDLTVCSRCDYTAIDVIGSIYIYCCD